MSLSSLPPPFFFASSFVYLSASPFLSICVILFFSFSQNHIPKNPRLGQRSISQTLTHTHKQISKHTMGKHTQINSYLVFPIVLFIIEVSQQKFTRERTHCTRHTYVGHTQTWLHTPAGSGRVKWFFIQKEGVNLSPYLFLSICEREIYDK